MSLIANYGNAVELRPIQGPPGLAGGPVMLLNGQIVSINDNAENYIKNGYDLNDIIYSIVNLIIDKIRLAPWSIYQVKDESSLKQLRALCTKLETPGYYNKAAKLQAKSLELVQDAGWWTNLVTYPNDKETMQDFIANGCGYKLLTGNKYIWGELIPGGKDAGKPNSLRLLPSQWIDIVVAKLFGTDVDPNILGYKNRSIPDKTYPVEEIMHEKYMNYNWNTAGAQLYGTSPMKAALAKVNLANSMVKTNTAKIQNGGVETVLFVDDPRPGVPAQGQLDGLKAKLTSGGEYTGPVNWGKIATSAYKMGAVKLGATPVELDLYQAEMSIVRALCNIFGGVPSTLLNDPENKTFNNMKEGEKALTSRCALPLLTSTRDNLNRKAQQSWKLPKNWIIDFDMTVYSELQEDMKEMSGWLLPVADRTGMSMNEVRDMMGLETRSEPIMDQPMINTQKIGVPLNEYDITSGINNELDA